MALVDHQQKILRKEIDEAKRPRPWLSPGELKRVIFDAVTETHFLKHLEVVAHAHFDPLRFEIESLPFEISHPLLELGLNRGNRGFQFSTRRHVLVRRVKIELVERADHVAADRLKLCDDIHGIAEKLHAQSVLEVRRHHINHVAAHAKTAAF